MWTIPRLQGPFTVFFFSAGILFGVCGSILYFRMASKVREAGVNTPLFGTVRDLTKVLRIYCQSAESHKWPRWPAVAFLLALAATFAAAFGLLFSIGLK